MGRIALFVAMIVTGLVAMPAVAEAAKNYRVDVLVKHVNESESKRDTTIGAGGERVSANVVITNEGTGFDNKIGSLNVTVPQGLRDGLEYKGKDTLADANPADGPGTVQLRDLKLLSGQKLTLPFEFEAPTVNGTHKWVTAAKNSSTFRDADPAWTLNTGSQNVTQVGSGVGHTVTADCKEGESCSVKLRHIVACTHAKALGAPLACDEGGSPGTASLFADTVSPEDYYVETLVSAPDGGNGELSLYYEDEDRAACEGYLEPSDQPGRFDGPEGSHKKVQFTISEEMWELVNDPFDPNDPFAEPENSQTESCFAAPYFFAAKVPDEPFDADNNGTFWYNGLLPDCPSAGPCVENRHGDEPGEAGDQRIDIDIPWPTTDGIPLIGGPDPYNQ